ncbi:ABC-F family ATP-binding cassette domain-containing protein [Teredinibacter waterburyi]|uniref:ABC-F family ATP-binding cassette domain-containing protein n=1 Tax=Teredinibacter waterburyi TaxID=1500538 RepID=UPI00165F10AE|nr:ATP-binding cassette domain-containing protein [Teredinibacter waterburyi]
MIQLQSVSLQRGNLHLLELADLTIYPGQKWGLVGANGSGKSSLFKLLLGELHEDAGQVQVPKQWQIGHMAQETGHSSRCAIDYVLDGDQPLRDLEQRIATHSGDGESLAALYQEMENIDGYTAKARAERLIHGLGFKDSDSNRGVNEFSGGWRIRLNLAQALMCRSDLLLLDEPTNHLDLDATIWLEQWLNQYEGTLLIISHDRDFLDNLAEGIIHVEQRKLISYNGNYSSFENQRAERLAQQAIEFSKQQTRVAEIEDFVRRFRAKATKAKQAQSRLKELERMKKIAPAHVDSPFSFRFPAPERMPQTLITLDDIDIGYGDTALVKKINLSILGSTRVGLLGHNGAGKTTLVKSLAETLPLVSGELTKSVHLRCGYFAQHQVEALDMQASCALHIQRISPKASEQEIRNFLGSFGFQGERAFECIQHFSGGEKARLALAILAWQKPNFLLLDEPTNHLDLEMRHALTLAIQAFEGAVIIVSHDRHLLRSTLDEYWLVDAGKVTEFEGDLEDYQHWLSKQQTDDNAATAIPSSDTNTAGNAESSDSKRDKKEQRQYEAQIRAQLTPFSKKIKSIENKMQPLQKKLGELETALADPELYAGASTQLTTLLADQRATKAALEELEMEWLEQNEAMENKEAELRGEN